MDNRKAYAELLDEAMHGKLNRRQIIRRAAVLGLSMPAVAALLAACNGDDEADVEGEQTPDAPAAETTPTEEMEEEEDVTPEATPEDDEATPEATPEDEEEVETPEPVGDYSMDEPPDVANADAASEYSGAQITYYGDSVGVGAEMDNALAAKFTEDTGIQVNVVPKPESATESYAAYQRFFQGQSPDVDVMMIDVIWPGAFAQHLVDLSETFSEESGDFYDTIIENNTVDGNLVAIPWFADFGMLYYRTDLLEEYGFDAPPATWEELREIAEAAQEGEQGDNPNFVGFVFQGNAYEGLTCNALEWVASVGGGEFVENGEVTINNPDAAQILDQARGWIDTISPRGVTGYQEEDARNIFQGGNAMFMRNWPYAYALASADDSPIAGSFDVAPLPSAEGQDSVGTVGGWQLAVSQYSQAQEASIEFVRYMTSEEVQRWRAVLGSYVPTRPAVAEDQDVLDAMPFLEPLADVVRVTRPSTETGERYNEVSTEIFQGVNDILNGAEPDQVLPQVEQRIQRIIG